MARELGMLVGQVFAAVTIKMVVAAGRQVKLNCIECFTKLFDHRTSLINILRIQNFVEPVLCCIVISMYLFYEY